MLNALLNTTLLAPFAGAALILLIPGRNPGAIRAVAVLAAAVSLFAALLFGVNGGIPTATDLSWVPSLNLSLHFGADKFSLPLLVLSAVIGLAAMLIGGLPERAKLYYLLLTLTLGACLAAFASLNLFIFYFCCELTTIPKYLLTAGWGSLPANRYKATPAGAAMQVTLYLSAGAMAALLALIALYVLGSSLDLEVLQASLAAHPISACAQSLIFGVLILGFGVWSAMWPFHTWSPLAYSAMPAPAAMLFAGVAKNFGAYALLRIGTQLLPEGARSCAEPLAIVAIVNILYGGWAAMQQKDWTSIIAYGSISHMGYLLLALAAAFMPGGDAGMVAATYFMVAHGLGVALLFALTGRLQQSVGSRWVPELGGLARSMPFLTVTFTIGVIASSGLPGFANFMGEVMVFIAAWATGETAFRIAVVAAVWGVVMTATYFFRALRSTFHGESRPGPVLPPPPLNARLAILLLIIASALAGIWPRMVTDAFRADNAHAANPTVGPTSRGTHPEESHGTWDLQEEKP